MLTASPLQIACKLGKELPPSGQAGVPVGVLVAPVIPGLNDHEIPSVLTAARAKGAGWAGTEILRLLLTVAPAFQEWLERNFPEKKEKILGRIRAIRGGKLNDPRFGSRMPDVARNTLM